MDAPRIIPAPGPDTRRVSVRRVSPTGAAGDVVGHLVAANDEWLVVLPDDRGAVWVPRSEATAVRAIPERTVLPASDAEAVERVLDPTWPGLRRARLGGWLLREGRGATGRANSVLAVGDPGPAFREALAAAADWYGRPARLQAVLGGRTADAALAAGMIVTRETLVLVRASEADPVAQSTEVAEAADGAWATVGGQGPDRLEEMGAAPAAYLRIGDDAVGRLALNGRWAVLTEIAVRSTARGSGLGRAVTRALMAEAHRRGARYLALQVEADNAVALGLYGSLGFVEHHRYGYLAEGD